MKNTTEQMIQLNLALTARLTYLEDQLTDALARRDAADIETHVEALTSLSGLIQNVLPVRASTQLTSYINSLITEA